MQYINCKNTCTNNILTLYNNNNNIIVYSIITVLYISPKYRFMGRNKAKLGYLLSLILDIYIYVL